VRATTPRRAAAAGVPPVLRWQGRNYTVVILAAVVADVRPEEER
jgi:hypothetical protein